jgi:hypothetical protein
LTAVPLAEQIACVRREISMRARVYPRWIAAGKMSAEGAAREQTAMSAVLQTLVEVEREQNPQKGFL